MSLIVEANTVVSKQIVAHEREDEATVYPRLSKYLSDRHGLAAMSRPHRKIMHQARLLDRIAADPVASDVDRYLIRDAQRVIESIEALVRIHNAQEQEYLRARGDALAYRTVKALSVGWESGAVSVAKLSIDKHGDGALCHDLLRLAPEQDPRNAAASVGSHDDQIAFPLGRDRNNTLCRRLILDVNRIARNSELLGRFANRRENLGGALRRARLIALDDRRHGYRAVRSGGKNIRYRHGRHPRSNRLREGKRTCHRGSGQLRAVGCYQQMPLHSRTRS